MEREIEHIRVEIAHCEASWEYARAERDYKGMKFILGFEAGLERALEILRGGRAEVDEEVEAWWNERKAGKGVGK